MNRIYFMIANIVLISSMIKGASDKQPITVGKVTCLSHYITSFQLTNGREINDLSELKPGEKVSVANVTNGTESSMFWNLQNHTPEEITKEIEEKMQKGDPAFSESSLYKITAASASAIKPRETASGSRASYLPAGATEQYTALNMRTGAQRIMAHKDDLREGEILNGVSIRY